MYLVQISLLLIGQQGLGHFFRSRTLLHSGWRIVQILLQRRRKTTNTALTTFGAIQAAGQSTLITAQLYSTCDLGNGKNKQLTLLSQRKLAINARNTLFAQKNHWNT